MPAAKVNVELPWGPLYERPADGLPHDGYCNEFYPNGPTTYARFIWAVRMLTRNGFVVLIDNHLNSDPTVTQNPAQWLQASLRSRAAPVSGRLTVPHATMLQFCRSQSQRSSRVVSLGMRGLHTDASSAGLNITQHSQPVEKS